MPSRVLGQSIRRGATGLVLSPQILASCLFVATFIGCDSLQKKHENPVLMDAPRRVSNIEAPDETQVADASSEIDVAAQDPGFEQVGFKKDSWATWTDDTAIFNSKVAATVNGAPILNGDVLDRYSGYLIAMRETMQEKRIPPEEYNKVREMFVQRDLPGHIQRRLLVESMKSTLKPEQVKLLDAHLDGLFEKEVEKLKRELKVSTRTELELELNKKGTTLQNVKDSFNTERMAMEYVAMKMDKVEHIDRMDLLEYYQAHLDDYAIPANVTWEQIQISFDAKSTTAKDNARARMQEALQELASGVPFETVAKKYSDSPTAKQGGQWEPMEAGSLADTKLEKMLFEMPVGRLSSIYEGPAELQIVRVKARQEAGRKQLGDVQDEIRQKLEQEQNKKRPEKLFKKLFEEAVIESKYDLPGLNQ